MFFIFTQEVKPKSDYLTDRPLALFTYSYVSGPINPFLDQYGPILTYLDLNGPICLFVIYLKLVRRIWIFKDLFGPLWVLLRRL